ncbi:MAG: hypothetical protein CBC97_06465, partial [Verrucomicrobiaceae bacterium TMED137]
SPIRSKSISFRKSRTGPAKGRGIAESAGTLVKSKQRRIFIVTLLRILPTIPAKKGHDRHGGCRIEDTVVITEEGWEFINTPTYDWVIT